VAKIFNTTIGSIVDVPDESVGAYLAQPAYRKVKASDPAAPPDTDTITVSRAEYEARVEQALQERLPQAIADALAKAATAETTPPAGETPGS
jgi:hypothetical protein